MAWTKSGTVNLTNGSAVVYGSGTAWVSGGMARAGDVFIAQSGDLYEVASIQSNTQLTLSSAFLGTTASGQTYSLIHTGLLPAELAINLSALQSKYLTTISQLWEWETSNAETVPLTNPATGVTTNVKPIAGLVIDVSGKAPIASPSFTGTLTHSGDIVLSGSGKRIIGDFSNATVANRAMFQTSTADTYTEVGVIPNGTGDYSELSVANASTPNDCSVGYIAANGEADIRLVSSRRGTGSFLPMTFHTNGFERMRIESSGNVLATSPAGLGYGPGAGGTVTQATSKSTAVTLNKPCGRITTHNETLAVGAGAYFTFYNSIIKATDTIVLNVRAYGGAHFVRTDNIVNGSCSLYIKNDSAGPQSIAVDINFAIIKGTTS